jgi:aminotransferase
MSVAARPRYRSARTADFTESVIRDMTRQAIAAGAVNLAQGFPDFPAPSWLKAAAARAIEADHNQYPITWGIPPLRAAIAAKARHHYGLDIDPAREVTVVCGATEGMAAVLLALVDPGDEVIVFEPYYENYHPDLQLCGATRKLVTLHAIIINSPNNPTGRVFTREELTLIASLCQEFEALCITDEIYEHIVYDGARHIPVMTLPGMRDRAVLVNSCSKTYSVTGWRVGWVLANPDLTDGIRKVHDFLTVGAATPLQYAAVEALQAPDAYYNELGDHYDWRRRKLEGYLTKAGFRCFTPRGAYYTMTDISGFGFSDDTAFVQHLIHNIGLAGVPGSSFFSRPELGHNYVRFCFCKKEETLEAAGERLARLT